MVSIWLGELIMVLVDCFFVENAMSFAVDEDNGFVYWGDKHILKRATLKGDNITDIIDTGKLLL